MPANKPDRPSPDFDAAEFWVREARAAFAKGDNARVRVARKLVHVALSDAPDDPGPPFTTGC